MKENNRTHHHRGGERRGSVAIAILVLLLLVGLMVTTLLRTVGRGHEMTVRGLESVQAFYAAEAGINMAMRELVLGVDEDGDGGVGNIADDGTDLSDPNIAGAHLRVKSSDNGSGVTLVSQGRYNATRHQMKISLSLTAAAAAMYNLANRTPGSDFMVYQGTSSTHPPANPTVPSAECSDMQYAQMSADDGVYFSNTAGIRGQYAQKRFVVEIDPIDLAVISGLIIEWTGRGVNQHPGHASGAAIWIWNYATEVYEELAASGDTSARVTLIGFVGAGVLNYLGGPDLDTVTILAATSRPAQTPVHSNTLMTDYIEIQTMAGTSDGWHVQAWTPIAPGS